MITKIKRPISILLVLLMVVGMFSVLPISASAAEWTFKLNSNFSGEWNADTDVVSEQPVELNLAEGDYEFQIVAYQDGDFWSYRGNELAGSFTENYSQFMYDDGGNAKFHADGGKYTLTYNAGDGRLTIAPVYVAQIGSTNYKTLEAAFAAAVDGDTIKVLADCSGNGIKVLKNKFKTNGLTVDFDGHTYTMDGETVGSPGTETLAFQLQYNNNITFKNGTLYSEKALFLVQNYSNLTLDNMTLTLDNPNYASAYTLSNNYGNTVIKDTTINANPAGKFAFDVCRGGGSNAYTYVHVTVEGNSTINGNVEVYAKNSDPKNGLSLTLNGGTMNGGIVIDQTAQNVIAATPEKAVISKADTFTQAAPADFRWVDNGDGTSTLAPIPYVAQIGTTKYETLQAAIDAAPAGATVELLTDVTLEPQTITGESAEYGAYITKSITLDGNNHSISTTAPRAIGVKGVSDKVDVTFKDVTIAVTKDQNNIMCICTRGGIGELTLDNTKLDTQVATKAYNQPLTIGGTQYDQAKVNVINGSVIQTNNEASKYYAIILWNPVELTIEDSTIKGWACVYQKAFEGGTTDKTEVTINNSTLISKGLAGSSNHFAAIVTEEAGFSCNITNSNIDVTAAENTYQGIATVSNLDGAEVKLGEGNDVTLTGNTAIIGFNFDDEAHQIAVSGGTFNKPVDEEYCADGFIPATLDETTGSYSVKTGTYVAQIGETKYETLEAAFAAAVDGDTIKVLADSTGNGIKVTPAGKFATNGLTVDFNGHTYTVDGETVGSTGTETNGFQLLKNNKVTFKDGTITSAKAKILVQNYSNLTLDGMTLTLNNPNYASAYTLSNNNGNIVIDDTTITANPAGGFAFDVCRYSSYPSVHVTVTGNSQINGDVEISASKGDAKDGFSLNLESGAMTGDIVVDAFAQALVGEDNKVTKANTFTQEAPADFRWVDNGDGTSTLAPIPYVAQIGDTKYETLEAAFAAAADGDTIKVLADSAGNGIKVAAGKFATNGLTVDFNGHTYTVNANTVGSSGTETQGFQLLKNNKITFENGTINGDSTATETLLFLIQNYSDLTLDKMNLELVGKFYNQYTLSNNNGNIVINDSTINAPTYGGVVRHDVNSYAFDVCRFSNYPSVNVKVTGNSTINGDVQIDAKKGDPKNGFSLTLESGTMNGDIKLTANAETAIDNNPDKASVNKKNTFNQQPAEGYEWKDNGDGTSTLVKVQKLFDSYSITLNGYIHLNYYIDTDAIPNYDTASDVTVTFTWDSRVTEYDNHYGDDVAVVHLKDSTPDADGLVKAYVPINAAQMANQIHATVYVDDVALAETNDYSVMEYAKTIINGNYDDATKTLVKEMLNYGAMAQTVFSEQHENPGVLANSVLSAADLSAISEEMSSVDSATIIDAVKDANEGQRGATIADLQSIGTGIGGKWYTTSVIFLNGNTLRHYFDDENEGAMNHEGATGVQDDWFYYVEKKNIAASDLDTLYDFSIGGQSFRYSVLDYAAAILNSSMGTDAENLAKALYLYNQAANAYFG